LTSSELEARLSATISLLNVPGVGKTLCGRLIKKFGSVDTIFGASLDELAQIQGISRGIASEIRAFDQFDASHKIAAQIVELKWTILFPDHPEYPPRLTQVSDPPPFLFRLGQPTPPESKMVAIVGTRHPSEAGQAFAFTLASQLCEAGITVVSGMAEGIDSAAHKGALDCGGMTVAVWGTPLNVIFPSFNRPLAEELKAKGTIYSEYLPDSDYHAANFPQRNRIISGLSEAVIVVEAGIKSGALITAELALEQGREVFAVPGSPMSDKSIGTNSLIKKGARLLTDIGDLFEELPRLKGEVNSRKFERIEQLTGKEQELVKLLADGPIQIDTLSRTSNLSVSELMEFLLALELKGIIQELSGKRFGLCE